MKPKNTKRATKPAKRTHAAKSPKSPGTGKCEERPRRVFPDPVPPVSVARVIALDGSLLRIAVDSLGSVVVMNGNYSTYFTRAEFSAVGLAVADAYANLNIDGGADL